MHNGIQNDPEKRCTENSIPSSQSRHEVCSQGQVEKGSLGTKTSVLILVGITVTHMFPNFVKFQLYFWFLTILHRILRSSLRKGRNYMYICFC